MMSGTMFDALAGLLMRMMSGNVFDALADLLMGIIFLLLMKLCIKFCVKWTRAGVAAVDDENRSPSEAPGHLQSQIVQAGDRPQGVRADLKNLHPHGRCLRKSELKVTFGGSVRVAGANPEPVADVFLRLDCNWRVTNPGPNFGSCTCTSCRLSNLATGPQFPSNCPTVHRLVRLSASHTRVKLILDQVDFGVNNCCTRNCSARNQSCDKKCKTVFIYKVTIQVCPKSWAQDCHRLLLQPYDKARTFGLQQSSALNVQMPFVCPRQATFSYQTSSTVSHEAPAFGWSPACRDDASKSVCWTWELLRYTNGRELEFNKSRWSLRPLLGIRPSYIHNHPGSFLAEASWDLPPNAELQQQELEWDIKLSFHTAVLQRKTRLLGYFLTAGPTLTIEKPLAF